MFYKAKFTEKIRKIEKDGRKTESSDTFEHVFEASSAQESDRKIEEYISEQKKYLGYYDNVDVCIECIGKKRVAKSEEFAELVEEELKELYRNIFNCYLRTKLKPRDRQKKYTELKEKYLGNPEYFYKMLKYTNKMINVEDYLGRFGVRRNYLTDMSAKQYLDRVEVLTNCSSDSIVEIK